MPSRSTQAQPDPRRFRAEVSCRWPSASTVDWAPSLSAARKLITAMRREFERAGKGSWSTWTIMDLEDLSIVEQGRNKHYQMPAHLSTPDNPGWPAHLHC